jgi:hypothetical protein
LTWEALRELRDGGLAEFASHTHDLHHYANVSADSAASEPALAARPIDPDRGIQESEAGHADRVYADLLHSRVRLDEELAAAPTVLNFPYGVHDAAATQAARAAGFTHFLLYGGNRFATYGPETDFVPRLSVTRVDESVPLAFPSDETTAQRWWLAFLRTAWWSRSPALLEATLAQLAPEAARQPRAEVARVALAWLDGDPAAARERLARLRRAQPDDPALTRDAEELLALYQSPNG